MAKVISLPIPYKKGIPAPKHVEAAWLLVYAALWQHESFPRQEVAYAQQIIQNELNDRSEPKPAFICYCERVLLANRLLQANPADWIDVPSIWFHPDHRDGFAGTTSLYRQIATKRQTIPGYQRGISIFANAYWCYINQPAPSLLKTTRKQLLQLKEYGLLQLWNNLIMLRQSK